MPQALYSSMRPMVYSMPASLKSAFFWAMDSSDSFGAKGFGKIQCLEMISASFLGMTQPLRLSAILIVAPISRSGMMPTSTGSQTPALRMASSQ